MRILSINNAYYIRGGGDRYFFELNNLLGSKGEEVIPFSVKSKKNFPTSFGSYFLSPFEFFQKKNILSYPRLAARVFYSQEAKRKLEVLIKKTRPHIAHLHTIHHSISPSILPVLKKYNIPVIFRIHNFEVICPNNTLFYSGKICDACKDRFYLRAALRRCYNDSFCQSLLMAVKFYIYRFMKIYERFVDVFVVPSEFLKGIFTECGFDKEKIVYLPWFLETSGFSPSYEDSDYFIYFRRICEGKGLKTLLKAMETAPNRQLYIAGDGPSKEDCERFAQDIWAKEKDFF